MQNIYAGTVQGGEKLPSVRPSMRRRLAARMDPWRKDIAKELNVDPITGLPIRKWHQTAPFTYNWKHKLVGGRDNGNSNYPRRLFRRF